MRSCRRCRSERHGFGLVQVLMASAAVAGLAVLVGSMMKNLNRSQLSVRLGNVASDLETRFRAVTLSSRALSRIREANPELANCLDESVGCTAVGIQPVKIVDAAGNLLIPSSTAGTAVNDGGSPCDPAAKTVECRWVVRATIEPLVCKVDPATGQTSCASCTVPGAQCVPSGFNLYMALLYSPTTPTPETVPMAPREILAKAIPKEMFMGPGGSLSLGARTTFGPFIATNSPVYTASVDGFVVAFVGCTHDCFTLQASTTPGSTALTDIVRGCFYSGVTMPVRKGDSWKARSDPNGTGPGTACVTLHWYPLGGMAP